MLERLASRDIELTDTTLHAALLDALEDILDDFPDDLREYVERMRQQFIDASRFGRGAPLADVSARSIERMCRRT